MDSNRRTRRILLGILEGLLTVLFLVLTIVMLRYFAGTMRIRREEAAAAEAMRAMESAAGSVEESASAVPEIQAEIRALMEQNGDAVGLLHFEGDRTLYVCQGQDNSHYMNHRFDGSEDPAGMIYMDWRNSLWPRSDNLILYGHNMRDGSRFGTLRRFEEKEYLIRYPVFRLAERYETCDYVPFAVFRTTVLTGSADYYAFDRIDFGDQAEFERYVADVKARSVLNIPVDVEYGEKLLTMVTCHSALERGRLVIVCREIREGEDFT